MESGSVIILLLILAAAIIFAALIIKNQERRHNESMIPMIKESGSMAVMFQPIEELSAEKEAALIPIVDDFTIKQIVDAIPKAEQAGMNAANAVKAAELANGGIYQAIIPNGAALDHSRTLEGAFKGSFRTEPNRIQGHADWILKDKEINQMAAIGAVNAIMNVASLVVGQYYMSEINKTLNNVEHNIASIKKQMDDKFYSEVMQLLMDVKHISEFRGEIFSNDHERGIILHRLLELESQCERLLIQANKQLTDLCKTESGKYEMYERDVEENKDWYRYLQGLVNVLLMICELRFVLNRGRLSNEYTHKKYYELLRKSEDTEKAIQSWHQKNIEKFGIDIELKHRERKGLNAAVWWIPGLLEDDLNYKKINESAIKAIKEQNSNRIGLDMTLGNPFEREVILYEKEGNYYYLPQKV